MAMRVEPIQIGVDVAKAELMVSINGAEPFPLPNNRKAIKRWLRQLGKPAELALEATNDFHTSLAELAHALGHKVFLISGFRLNRYRDSIGGRAKTDKTDACLLVRYLQKEREELRPWEPPSREYRQLQLLLRRRANLIQAKVALQQSFEGLPMLRSSLRSLFKQIKHIDGLMTKRIFQLLGNASWLTDAQRCQAIEGIGPLTSAALAMSYHRGAFRSSDSFVAFLGLDVRVRESGTMRGKRRLTKQGDPELRRLLYLAAMQAKRQFAWQAYYQRYIDRGLAATQALNILARKLARVAFALMRNQSDYQPGKASHRLGPSPQR